MAIHVAQKMMMKTGRKRRPNRHPKSFRFILQLKNKLLEEARL
jgi:hypothetical protein